jgi:hypothetical protein
MEIQTSEPESGRAATYVAWGTMKNAIEGLAQGVHHRIDRTAFPGLSGGAQTALLAGLKFLGLITADGAPTPALHALAVPDEAARKKQLEAILRERYADLFALNLTKITPAMLEEKMGESYNVSGSTRDRAVRFFLSAMQYLEVPVSPLLKRATGNGSSPTPRKRRSISQRPKGSVADTNDDDTTPGAPPSKPSGTSRTVTLKSGGTLTLSASLNIFDLSDEDQAFVFELIAKLKKYEQA